MRRKQQELTVVHSQASVSGKLRPLWGGSLETPSPWHVTVYSRKLERKDPISTQGIKYFSTYTHVKSRVEAAPDVELFPYILDNTMERYYFGSRGSAIITTLIWEELYLEVAPSSAKHTLVLLCMYYSAFDHAKDPVQ